MAKDNPEGDSEDWLAGLGNMSLDTDHTLRRVGNLVRAQQDAAESEFDDIRMARSRRRLEAALSGPAGTSGVRRWWALASAASVALVIFVILQGDIGDPTLVAQYGNLERARASVDLEPINLSAKQVQNVVDRLSELQIPFALFRISSKQMRLELMLPSGSEQTLIESDVARYLGLKRPGRYAFDIEIAEP